MNGRIPNVLVIGSARSCEGQGLARAQAAGRLVARAGVNLVTGGRGGAMEAVGEAFLTTPDRVGKAVGILPGSIRGLDGDGLSQDSQYEGSTPNPWVEIAIRTHLPGEGPRHPTSRNYINILSADLVIALAGGAGTEAKLDIALALGKRVIAFIGEDEAIGRYRLDTLPEGVARVPIGGRIEETAFAILASLTPARPRFADVLAGYSTDAASVHDCTIPFPNTCAIRMSEALVGADPAMLAKFRASGLNVCPHGYMRGAQDLANVLRRADAFGTYNQGFSNPGSAPASMNGRKGVICYMNIPSYPDGQGHIDLWDNTGPVGSAYWSGDPIWFWHLD